MIHFNPDYTIQWYYNECHPRKGPMNSVECTVKNIFFRHGKSNKCGINGAKDFAEYANKIINGISCLYLAENEIMTEPQYIEKSRKISKTLKVHKSLRSYIEDNVCKMEFYELTDETDPFHIQWYHKEGDPEVWRRNQLPLNYETDQTCGYCKERCKRNEEWNECKLYVQWFHEACFEK